MENSLNLAPQYLFDPLHRNFHHHELDIRNRAGVLSLLQELRPALVMHTAAQPSHDLAASRPFDDFDVNAVGTHNLLESTRLHAPDCVFVHMSTNKVYGDRPNTIRLKELPTRWEYDDPQFATGIPEDFPIDQSKHSVFGASKPMRKALDADCRSPSMGRITEVLSEVWAAPRK